MKTMNLLRYYLAVSLIPLLVAGCGKKSNQPIDEASGEDDAVEITELSRKQYSERWRIKTVGAATSGRSVYRPKEKGYYFATYLLVLDENGIPIRGLPAPAFNFSIDGILDRDGMAGNDLLQIYPALCGAELNMVMIVDGASGVRIWGEENSGALAEWLSAFSKTLPEDSWKLRVWMYSGDELRNTAKPSVFGSAAAVSTLVDLCKLDFRPAGNMADAIRETADTDSFSPNNIPVLFVVSHEEGYQKASGLAESVAYAKEKGWIVRVLQVGHPTGDYIAGVPMEQLKQQQASEQGSDAAMALVKAAAPGYLMELSLDAERIEADNLERSFVVRVEQESAGGYSNKMPFTIQTRWASWAIVLFIGAAITLILLFATLVYLVVWALRQPLDMKQTVSSERKENITLYHSKGTSGSSEKASVAQNGTKK